MSYDTTEPEISAIIILLFLVPAVSVSWFYKDRPSVFVCIVVTGRTSFSILNNANVFGCPFWVS